MNLTDFNQLFLTDITSDPIGLDRGLNTCSYVSASPLRFFDVDSLAKFDIFSAKRLKNWAVKKFNRMKRDDAKRQLRNNEDLVG